MEGGLLAVHIAAAVPLRIADYKRLRGPSDEDFARVSGYSSEIGEKGDLLLFGGGKKGEAAGLMNKVVDGIAVLAFVPGGVEMFGIHFEAKKEAVT